MSKPQLIFAGDANDECTRLNSGSSMSNGTVTIQKMLYFRVPDGENPRQYNDIDVYGHPSFPRKYSALSQDARYRFYGNASLEHSDDGKYFTATLDYSTSNPNSTDSDGNAITSDTPPWRVKPDDVHWEAEELQVPFRRAYNSAGSRSVHVRNTAGDPFLATTTRKRLILSFSYAVEKWRPDYTIRYGNSVNLNNVRIVGWTIPAGCALLCPPTAEQILVTYDNSSRIRWKYYNVSIRIIVDFKGFERSFDNLGNRANFPSMTYTDALIPGISVAAVGRSQICSYRKWVQVNQGNDFYYVQTGDRILIGFSQFITLRNAAINRSIYLSKVNTNYKGGVVDPQCEQLSQIALDENGYILDGYDTGSVLSLSYNEWPSLSWSALNLPKEV